MTSPRVCSKKFLSVVLSFKAEPGTGNIKAFALRCGLPFPVVQWQSSANAKVLSCIAPQSLDTLSVKGNIGARFSASAVPLLAAWANHESMTVICEMALQAADGKIYVAATNATLVVQETDYKLPEQFSRPPPEVLAQMQKDPRFAQQMLNQQQRGREELGQADQQSDFREKREGMYMVALKDLR